MKIVLFATTILEHGGGFEKLIVETAKNLSKFEGNVVDIVTMDNNFTEMISLLLTFYYFKKTPRKNLYKESLSGIRQNIGDSRYIKCHTLGDLRKRLSNYDIIYSKNEILEGVILKFLVGYDNLPPIIFGCHTSIKYPNLRSVHSIIHNFLYTGLFYKWIANGVSGFHVTNKFDLNLVKSLFPKKNVRKIYNPFNADLFEFNLKHFNYDNKWSKNKLNILWIGRLDEQKGVPSLSKVIDIINNNVNYYDKVVFNILGDGPMRDILFQQEAKWNNVNLFGYVEYKYLPSIYRNNDILISTSSWEAFGYNVLEAQASGMPVVSFNIPGPQDIVINKKTGFLVASEEEMVDKVMLFEKKSVALDSSKNIKSYISNSFSPSIIYAKMNTMFVEERKK